MNLKVDPTQINWLKLVAKRRLSAATKTNDVTGAELFNYIIGKVESVAGDKLVLTRKGARVVERMCLDHITFMRATLIPEMSKRQKTSGTYAQKLNEVSFLLTSIEALYKRVKESL